MNRSWEGVSVTGIIQPLPVQSESIIQSLYKIKYYTNIELSFATDRTMCC